MSSVASGATLENLHDDTVEQLAVKLRKRQAHVLPEPKLDAAVVQRLALELLEQHAADATSSDGAERERIALRVRCVYAGRCSLLEGKERGRFDWGKGTQAGRRVRAAVRTRTPVTETNR